MGKRECVWVVGALAGRAGLSTWAARQGPGAEGALQPSSSGGVGPRTPRDSRGWLGRVAGPAGAGTREKSGGCADLLPSRSCQARQREAGGLSAPRARVHRGRAPCSLPGGCRPTRPVASLAL